MLYLTSLSNPRLIFPRTQSFSVITDIDAFLAPLSPDLFPGVSSDVEVHSGFGSEQAWCVGPFSMSSCSYSHLSTATDILEAVQRAIAAHSATSVTTTGHSLGYVRLSTQ